MNHDPIKFCSACQKPKPRAGFRSVTKVRQACSDCYPIIMAGRRDGTKKRSPD